MKQLRYIENRLKYRNTVGGRWGFDRKVSYGKGTCALFYGPAGTGKTMAAKVLANELGLALYRVDLSRMVSKYIGETQKHISALFEHAKSTNALLFFDEADALFAKRTEVGDSHDRNANSEVAHLLQKLEEYDGISILATNLKDNIDDAFKRRIKYMIHFRMPDAETRAILWQKMLPGQAPADEDLDLAFFAENFELSGSEIKDAMLHAAYMAAAEGGSIGNRHLMEAVRLSSLKYGKVLTKENFGYIGL
ncbi:MAG: ATP-binding protein [Acetatifactor sp.]|nr:ATP-binding protein [Acetatifactor sp.]